MRLRRFLAAATLVAFLVGLAAPATVWAVKRRQGAAASSLVRQWSGDVTSSGVLIRVDCESETNWTTGAKPKTRSYSVSASTPSTAAGPVFFDFDDPVVLDGVDMTGPYTDLWLEAGDAYNTSGAFLQVAMDVPGVTVEDVVVRYECGR